MNEKRSITIKTVNRRTDKSLERQVIPLRIMISAQSGRQYLMAYIPRLKRISSFRTDYIVSVRPWDVSDRFGEMRKKLDGMLPHIWGVSTQSISGERMEHVEFTVTYADDEKFILKRLEREKRCGSLEIIDDHTVRFSADVFDTSELIPWIRTFICRITDYSFSNKVLERQFASSLEEMYHLYGIEDGEKA